MRETNMMLMSDFYKQGHPEFYPEGLDYLATYGTARNSRLDNIHEMVVFGIRGFAQDYLVERFNSSFFNKPKEEAVNEVADFLKETFDCTSFNIDRIAELHDLGYLPVRLWSLPEGTMVPIYEQKENPGVVQVPYMMYESTHPKFAWVVEFLESITSCQTWYPMVIATITKKGYRDTVDRHWKKSVVGQSASTAISEFGFRGAQGSEGAIMASSAFLTSFNKTATVPAIKYVKDYYGKGMKLGDIGSGMSSTEHSVMCSNYAVDGNENDFMIKLFTEIAPSGNVSVVSDSYDYWGRIAEMGREGSPVKAAIMARSGCLFVRGDSGNPLDIICGTKKFGIANDLMNDTMLARLAHRTNTKYFKIINSYQNRCKVSRYVEVIHNRGTVIQVRPYVPTREELGTVGSLFDSFGGTINDKQYIVLNDKVRAIYGDSITPYLTEQIYSRLEDNGFAANNVALGAGSFSMQAWEERDKEGNRVLKPHTRDTFGIAFKATYCEVKGVPHQVFKAPKTDSGNFKKSQRGMVYVYEDTDGSIKAKDGFNRDTLPQDGLMQVVFENGNVVSDESMNDVRQRLHKGSF